MFGKKISEYLRFQGWVLVLIVVTFVLRLTLAASWASLNLIGLIGLIYYAVGVHLSGFGSYKQLLPLLYIQTAVTHLPISIAIMVGTVTRADNVFTRPEFFGGTDGKTWLHASLHLIAIAIAPLVSWLFASGIMFVTRLVVRRP